ncbi:MAG: ABC transporter ATP-binding protein [Azospirillaceae bacterium]|nr:ABC transporter ATP-binding protein [Azospirillaceae bacterium]
MIVLQQVSHRFGDKTVLHGLTLSLAERRIGVVGANGSGKSTFARLLNGLVMPSSGQVAIDGLDSRRDTRALRRKVGFVFQDPDNQIVMPTVAEDIAFGLRNLGLPRDEITRRTDAILESQGLMALRDQAAHLLSGGEKQMLAIAAVLVMAPAYIVFDEPTTLLDLRNRRQIARIIAALPQVAIVVTHDLDLIQDFERVIVLDQGRLVRDGPAADVIPFYQAMMASDRHGPGTGV